MNERYYVVEVTTASNGNEVRNLTGYDNYDTALRKFFAPFGSVGAGPKKICVQLLNSNLDSIKHDIWAQLDSTEDESSEE